MNPRFKRAESTSEKAGLEEESQDFDIESSDDKTDESQEDASGLKKKSLARSKDKKKRKKSSQKASSGEDDKKKKPLWFRILRAFLLLVLALVLAAVVACVGIRWFFVNDASDIQGTWNIVGTEKNIPITDTEMTLDEDLTYKYSLDQVSKKINVKLGNMSGTSHYKFSLDRSELVVFDGDYDELKSFNLDFLDFWKRVQDKTFSPSSAGYTDLTDLKVIRLKKVG